MYDFWADLGSVWRIHEYYYKPYPVCRWAQPVIRAVLDLRDAHGLTLQQVDRIEVETFHQSRRLATTRQRTTEEAQHSTAYPSAVALVRGGVVPGDLAPESFSDPEIRRIAGGMIVTENAGYSAAYSPFHPLSARRTQARGDPEMPLDAGEIRGKFRRYARPDLGEARTERSVLSLGTGSVRHASE